jgi:Domain of unknown function (DUF4129)
MGGPGWDQGGEGAVSEDRQPGRQRAPGRGSPSRAWRAALLGLAAAGLLALVAAGSLRGPLGSGRGRPSYPADLIDSLLLVLLVAVVAAAGLVVVVLLPDHPRRQHGPRRWRLVNLGLFLPAAVGLGVWLFRDLLGLGDGPGPTSSSAPVGTVEVPAPPPTGMVPLLAAGVAVLAVVAVVAGQLLGGRRRPPRTPAGHLAELLDDTLEDLEREPDPRLAVIAAWARMERGLAAAGLPRRPAEAPFEYAARVLESAWSLELRRAGRRPVPVHRLTALFERAKFSHHAIGPADRDEAIAILRAVRAGLAEALEPAAAAPRPGPTATGAVPAAGGRPRPGPGP